MELIEVDDVDAEALQAPLAGTLDVPGAPVEAAARRVVRVADDAALRGEDDALALSTDGAADQLLVRVGAVHVRGVEQRDAELEGAMDRRDRLALVTGPVEIAHPHAAEPEGTGGEGSELAGRERRHGFLDARRADPVARARARVRAPAQAATA